MAEIYPGNCVESADGSYRMVRHLRVAMRDDLTLATDLFLPAVEGAHPVALVRTPYDRERYIKPFFPQHGIVLVTQDCRGRYDSDGTHHPFEDDVEDGDDTLQWIFDQPWCNGRIGMFGGSYVAYTQYAAASNQRPELTALAPYFMTGDGWARGYYCGGALSLSLTWSWLCFVDISRTNSSPTMELLDVETAVRHLPIIELDEAAGVGVSQLYRSYVSHNQSGDYWNALTVAHPDELFYMPTLFIAGWYDNYPTEMFRSFLGARHHPTVGALHRIVMGPWPHGINAETTLGDLDFGEAALAENDCMERWLEAQLHGQSSSSLYPSPIRLFVMGSNTWQDEQEWPPARAVDRAYYLCAKGALSTDAPLEGQVDHVQYDPNDPVPTCGGNHSVGSYNPGLFEYVKPGPFDQSAVESRSDVLTYTSAPLDEDLEVIGNICMILYASSSARDTDFVTKLCDVYPDGRSINITDGILRARFREDLHAAPVLMDPGTIYCFEIDMLCTANVFKKGHAIRVDVMNSNFPLYDRNLNTGKDPATDTEILIADQNIYHSQEYPSRIILPVIPTE